MLMKSGMSYNKTCVDKKGQCGHLPTRKVSGVLVVTLLNRADLRH